MVNSSTFIISNIPLSTPSSLAYNHITTGAMFLHIYEFQPMPRSSTPFIFWIYMINLHIRMKDFSAGKTEIEGLLILKN